MDAFGHGDRVGAGAEGARLLSAGAVDVFAVFVVAVDVAVEHGDNVGFPPVGP